MRSKTFFFLFTVGFYEACVKTADNLLPNFYLSCCELNSLEGDLQEIKPETTTGNRDPKFRLLS